MTRLARAARIRKRKAELSHLEALEQEEVFDVWLNWALESGRVYLRAISTTEARAQRVRKVLEAEPGVLRAYVERSVVNHIFGASFIQTMKEAKS